MTKGNIMKDSIQKEKPLTKRQHYVPQFYLGFFTDNTNKLHVFNVKRNELFSCPPKDICYEEYLYETPWKEANPKLGKFILPNEIENNFGRRESAYNALLKKIIQICKDPANKNALICNSEEKVELAQFTANLLVRNNWSMKKHEIESSFTQIIDNPEIKSIDQLLRDLDFGGTELLIKAAGKKVRLDESFDGNAISQIADQLLKVNFSILTPEKGCFITSGFPIIYETYDDKENGFTYPEYFYLPIHPRYALLYSCTDSARDFRNRLITIPQEKADFFNRAYLKKYPEQTQILISDDKSYLENLIKI